MPRLGFSIVPLDPFKVPHQSALEAVERQCKSEFSPLFTEIKIYDIPHLIISGENEVCMSCPKCGELDTEYKWLDLLPPDYKKSDVPQKSLSFESLMPCCNQNVRIFDFNFEYPSKSIEKGAGFASAEVCITETSTRNLNSQDIESFSEIMGCPVGAIMVTS